MNPKHASVDGLTDDHAYASMLTRAGLAEEALDPHYALLPVASGVYSGNGRI